MDKKDSILEKWSKKYKSSIDCSNPKGFSQRAHCAGRRKRKRGGKTKSRPVESLREKTMTDIKKLIINEINTTVKKESVKKKINESSKNLYESIKVASELKKENKNPEKIKIAENLIFVAEKRLVDDYDSYDEVAGKGCNCGEGEGEMLKAQILSIMANAQKIYHMIDDEDQFEDWIQSKITIAEDYLRVAYSYLAYSNSGDEVQDDDFEEDDWDDIEEWEGEWDETDEEYGEMEVNHPALDANVDDESFEKMQKIGESLDESDEKWIQKAIKKPGQLHKDLDKRKGEKIPVSALKKAAKQGGKVGQRARLALTLRDINK